jgi:hypothetical protein
VYSLVTVGDGYRGRKPRRLTFIRRDNDLVKLRGKRLYEPSWRLGLLWVENLCYLAAGLSGRCRHNIEAVLIYVGPEAPNDFFLDQPQMNWYISHGVRMEALCSLSCEQLGRAVLQLIDKQWHVPPPPPPPAVLCVLS